MEKWEARGMNCLVVCIAYVLLGGFTIVTSTQPLVLYRLVSFPLWIKSLGYNDDSIFVCLF